MASIIRDPLVQDHIVELGIVTEEQKAEVRQRYEEGNLIWLRGVKLDLDFQFLNALNFDVDGPPEVMRKVKKLGAAKILALGPTFRNSIEEFIFKKVFDCDAGKLTYFQEQVRTGNAQSDDLYASLFPAYVCDRNIHTWRFTSTKFENLHWDNFGISEPFQQVRIFTNISRSPRVWRTSHRIDYFADSIYKSQGLDKFSKRNADDLNYYINNSVLGGLEAACMERLPKNHVAFEQGDLWLCETRIISHQIYLGEKAFAAMYFSDPATMYSPDLSFDNRIAQLHMRHEPGFQKH